MKYHTILFSAPMVRALLDGSKTQTRRVVKNLSGFGQITEFQKTTTRGYDWTFRDSGARWNDVMHARVMAASPYGQPGERLWVREAFDFLPAGGPDQPQACEIVYWATGSHEPRTAPIDYNPMIYGHEKIRPSIHMPRWASRITLEITGVRVERLQDISEADARAEGVMLYERNRLGPNAEDSAIDYRQGYRWLWEYLNGPGSWDANPWVWVVEFRRIEE